MSSTKQTWAAGFSHYHGAERHPIRVGGDPDYPVEDGAGVVSQFRGGGGRVAYTGDKSSGLDGP
ncbi:hypothetical protein KI387_026375, partial [Taxus chinensis]